MCCSVVWIPSRRPICLRSKTPWWLEWSLEFETRSFSKWDRRQRARLCYPIVMTHDISWPLWLRQLFTCNWRSQRLWLLYGELQWIFGFGWGAVLELQLRVEELCRGYLWDTCIFRKRPLKQRLSKNDLAKIGYGSPGTVKASLSGSNWMMLYPEEPRWLKTRQVVTKVITSQLEGVFKYREKRYAGAIFLIKSESHMFQRFEFDWPGRWISKIITNRLSKKVKKKSYLGPHYVALWVLPCRWTRECNAVAWVRS